MVNTDISKAYTLPAEFYRSSSQFDQMRDLIFKPAWNFIGPFEDPSHNVRPVNLLPGYLDEPLVLSRDREGHTRCLSNVCTHRGNLVVDEAGNIPIMRCRYHGRCFGLDGSFRSMPGFEEVENFPTEEDHLHKLNTESIGPMHFAQINDGPSFESVFEPMLKEMSWFDYDDLTYRPEASQDYFVNAHWALYCDNYLEGFHVPFVHPGLNEALDVEEYTVELYDNCSLQIGIADDDENSLLDIPASHRLGDKRIYAMYWWVFPNLMFNFYPWGISFNVVEPVSLNETRIRFLTFAREGMPDPDIGSIHQTELEDEVVVESVQRGLQSSFYQRGRFSPKHEKAVHHFHLMLSNYLNV